MTTKRWRRLPLLSAALLVTGLLSVATPASAGAITVTRFDDPAPAGACDPGDCSLREGIMAANAAPGPNTIALQAGTYELTIEGDGEEIGAQGDLDLNDDLTIRGAGPRTTVIDGDWPSDPDRIFHIHGANRDLVLAGLRVQDGDAGTALDGGAVVLPSGSSLAATDVEFVTNRAGDMGTIESSGTIVLTRVRFVGNVARISATNGCCAGIYQHPVPAASLTATDVVFENNESERDSTALYIEGGTASVTNALFSGNHADVVGGVIGIGGGTVTLTNITVTGNTLQAADGAGIRTYGGDLVLNNATVTGNTVVGGDGGGFYSGGGTATIRNSIIAGNIDVGGEAPDCAGGSAPFFTSGGGNLIGSSTGCTFTPATGDLQNVDPKLGPLADNGGFTQTHSLLKGSPAIGAAGPDAAPTDQRGLQRKDPDMGAYEQVLCAKVPVNLIGTEGKDTLRGTSGPDGMLGLGGKDTLSGKGGKDGLCGGGGKDKLKGGGGKDTMKGQGGKDTCVGGGGKDKATCEKEKKVP